MSGLPTGLDRTWVHRHAVLYFFCVLLQVLHLGSYCVYTPPKTYPTVPVIRPCFFVDFCFIAVFKSHHRQGTPHMYGLSRGGASARLLAIGFARKIASSVTSAPKLIVDISIADISHPRPQVVETFD